MKTIHCYYLKAVLFIFNLDEVRLLLWQKRAFNCLNGIRSIYIDIKKIYFFLVLLLAILKTERWGDELLVKD